MRKRISQPVPVLGYGRSRRATFHWPTSIAVVGVVAILNVLPHFRPRGTRRLAHTLDAELGWPWVFLWNYTGEYIVHWQRLTFDLAVMAALAIALGSLNCHLANRWRGRRRTPR